MTAQRIPFVNTPQTFLITLGDNDYYLTNKWNEIQGWVIDIADTNQAPIVSNIPLTIGRNLLEPFGYMNFGGAMLMLTDGSDTPPTIDNLGTDSNLYWVTA